MKVSGAAAVFGRGVYAARLAVSAQDVRACQHLRYLAFVQGRGLAPADGADAGMDYDRFDAGSEHLMIEERDSGRLVCCARIIHLNNGREISRAYSAQYYELKSLHDYPGPMIELGRFCLHPAVHDPAILRVAWAWISRFVEERGVSLMFGCSSFHGVDADHYLDAFALLKERHLAPVRWLPRIKAPRVFRFAAALGLRKPDLRLAMRRMPPLLRTYLGIGGWVSDHAVIDNQLNTLHVFTGVEIWRIPQARLRALRG